MSIRVGLLTEGHDHLILLAYLARLLGIPEEEFEPDVLPGLGHGWQFVERTVDTALRRFYSRCAVFAVVSMDNDGNLNLRDQGGTEDPRHPRHWLHAEQGTQEACRRCRLSIRAEETRPALNWLPRKPGNSWPILIVVPVESIEAWLLTTQAILSPGNGSLHAESELRSTFKHRFYGRPEAREDDVRHIALPMIRQLDTAHIQVLKSHSRSFDDFAKQVANSRDEIETTPDCW